MAAILSCASDAVLSHRSLATSFGLLPAHRDDPVHISSMSWRRATRARRVHEPVHRSIRGTGARTTRSPLPPSLASILDIAETGTHDELERVLNEAHFAFDVQMRAVAGAAHRAPGRHGLKPVARPPGPLRRWYELDPDRA